MSRSRPDLRPLLHSSDSDNEEPEIQYRKTFTSSCTFSWIHPLLQWLHRQSDDNHRLTVSHLDALPSHLTPEYCSQELYDAWNKNSKDQSLLRALARAYGARYLALGLFKALNDSLNFAPALLLNRLLAYLDTPNHDDEHKEMWWNNSGMLCAVILASILFFKALLNAHYGYQQSLIAARLRMSLTTLIFKKTLAVNTAALADIGQGHVQTLMSVDADRVVGLVYSLHDAWSLPLQIIISLWLLYTQVQFAFLAGLALIILLIPINKLIANKIQAASVKMMTAKDKRVKVLIELLTGIRQIKAATWEEAFIEKVDNERRVELRALATRKYLDALCVYFWAATSVLFSLLTFGLFAWSGQQLTAQIVFTSLALFNVLLTPINAFPWVINGLIEAFISVKRVEDYFRVFEDEAPYSRSAAAAGSERAVSVAVEVDNASFAWSPALDAAPVLDNISLSIPSGSLVVVKGSIGSGKSSLLNAMVGELIHTRGSIHIQGSVAYVPQDPWLLGASTIRENILLASDYDFKRYDDVIQACCLTQDFESLAAGDVTAVGDKGATLSGGQKARISLARALYQNRDVYMLDDVLAAVDGKVATWLIQKALTGPLLAGKTVIIVSHHRQILRRADMVITMAHGKIGDVATEQDGTASELEEEEDGELQQTEENTIGEQQVYLQQRELTDGTEIALGYDNIINNAAVDEEREIGHVEWKVYSLYLKQQGLWVPITLISLFLMQATRNGNDLWLSYWVSQNNNDDTSINKDVSFYLTVLLAIAIVSSICTLVRAFSFAKGGLVAAKKLHQKLLESVVYLPIAFFDSTPSGAILNRFSSDATTADDSLPFIANIWLAHAFGLSGITVVLLITQPLLLLGLLPMAGVFKWLQTYYRCTSRELRRLEAVCRSPVYSTFSDALHGGSSIRAYDAKSMFLKKANGAIRDQQQTSIMNLVASTWLSLRLQIMAAFLAGAVGILAVLQHQGILPGERSATAAGLVGLSLSYVLPITGMLSSLLVTGAETEQEMVAVERISQYLTLEKQAQVIQRSQFTPRRHLTADWPEYGHIIFDHVWMQYSATMPFVLKNLHLKISAGSRVGICGRTGAGKSSVISCLLRLTEYSHGSITIDGVDVQSIPLKRLREKIGLVPQVSFIFAGSVRENMDPLQQHSDGEMIVCLKEVQLWEPLSVLLLSQLGHRRRDIPTSVLDVVLKDGGAPLSHGQRQLLSLSRVLLRQPKIVCLDECTANTDPVSTAIIRQVLQRGFGNGATIIEIAHNLDNIVENDVVVVIKEGRVSEIGVPAELLSRKGSEFSSMMASSKSKY